MKFIQKATFSIRIKGYMMMIQSSEPRGAATRVARLGSDVD